MQRDVFISYSRKNYNAVMEIKSQIDEATGADCWMDLKGGIETGADRYDDEIIKGINCCSVFLFMLSEESQKSDNAIGELDLAKAKGKRIVLVNINNCLLQDRFILHYGRADIIDWMNYLQRDKMLKDIKLWIHDEKLKQLERIIVDNEAIWKRISIVKSRDSGRIDPKTGIKNEGKCGLSCFINGEYIWNKAHHHFKEGLLAVAKRDNENSRLKWGFVSIKEVLNYRSIPDVLHNNMIIPYKYKAVNDFSGGYALVADFEDNCFQIDKMGLVVKSLGKARYN